MDTVAVCDLEPVAIEGLRRLFESDGKFCLAAAENSLVEGLGAILECRPAVLILDKALGNLAVVDCLRMLRTVPERIAVVVWGDSISEPEALRFLHAGAAGVLLKTSRLASILACIRAVASGETWMDSEMLEETECPSYSLHSPLTPRESQVMNEVERGMKNKEIAQVLGIQVGTVKIHLKHIFEKTGTRGRYGLALLGLKEKGLLASLT